MTARPRVTIRDIARELGLAHSTVSCALNHSGRVAAETRAQVLATAARLGYRQDPALSALNSYRQGRVAHRPGGNLAIVHELPDRQLHHFARALHREAVGAAARAGFVLRCYHRQPDEEDHSLATRLAHRGIRGCCFTFCRSGRWRIDLDAFTSQALVFIGHSCDEPVHRVTTDDFSAMRRLWHLLADHGYQRIGLVLCPSTDANSAWAWSGAYLSEQVRAPEGALASLPICPADDAQTVTAWLRDHQPDVVISRRSVRRILEAAGHRIPESIGYVNLGVPAEGVATAGYILEPTAVAEAAIGLLNHCLRLNDLGRPDHPTIIQLRPRWNEGHSLRPPTP